MLKRFFSAYRFVYWYGMTRIEPLALFTVSHILHIGYHIVLLLIFHIFHIFWLHILYTSCTLYALNAPFYTFTYVYAYLACVMT